MPRRDRTYYHCARDRIGREHARRPEGYEPLVVLPLIEARRR